MKSVKEIIKENGFVTTNNAVSQNYKEFYTSLSGGEISRVNVLNRLNLIDGRYNMVANTYNGVKKVVVDVIDGIPYINGVEQDQWDVDFVSASRNLNGADEDLNHKDIIICLAYGEYPLYESL